MKSLKKNGFSLIETVIALTVVAVVLTGSARFLFTLISSTNANQDRITATYLAQECLELTRNIRDTTWKQNLPWDCAFSTTEYDLEINNFCGDLEQEYGEISAENLELGSRKQNSTFQRAVTAEVLPSAERIDAEEILFRCTIEWDGLAGQRQLEMSHILTNWRKR